jgi:hypothetical protein
MEVIMLGLSDGPRSVCAEYLCKRCIETARECWTCDTQAAILAQAMLEIAWPTVGVIERDKHLIPRGQAALTLLHALQAIDFETRPVETMLVLQSAIILAWIQTPKDNDVVPFAEELARTSFRATEQEAQKKFEQTMRGLMRDWLCSAERVRILLGKATPANAHLPAVGIALHALVNSDPASVVQLLSPKKETAKDSKSRNEPRITQSRDELVQELRTARRKLSDEE